MHSTQAGRRAAVAALLTARSKSLAPHKPKASTGTWMSLLKTVRARVNRTVTASNETLEVD